MNISYSTLMSQYQRRSKSISLETIKKIASYLSVSVDYLINGENSTSEYIVSDQAQVYQSDNENVTKELIRIYQQLSLRNKTKLLAFAYELEAIESGK